MLKKGIFSLLVLCFLVAGTMIFNVSAWRGVLKEFGYHDDALEVHFVYNSSWDTETKEWTVDPIIVDRWGIPMDCTAFFNLKGDKNMENCISNNEVSFKENVFGSAAMSISPSYIYKELDKRGGAMGYFEIQEMMGKLNGTDISKICWMKMNYLVFRAQQCYCYAETNGVPGGLTKAQYDRVNDIGGNFNYMARKILLRSIIDRLVL